MRGKVKNRNIPQPDRMYQSEELGKFINYVMLDGKKSTAQRLVYEALDIIKEREEVENPLTVFDTAIKNIGPLMEVRSRRVGGANYQVPREVRPQRRQALAFRWILDITRKKSGKPTAQRLADEIIAASKGEGEAVAKKENMHKMAEANKAFAHFAF